MTTLSRHLLRIGLVVGIDGAALREGPSWDIAWSPEEDDLLQMASVKERSAWQRFLERRYSYPSDDLKAQVQPESQLMAPLRTKRRFRRLGE
eukprot:symbB.v1.2.039403.t1/scaffold6539.1/size17257/1